MKTCEDCMIYLLHHYKATQYVQRKISLSDINFITSVSDQVTLKKLALTKKQHIAVKSILLKYKWVFKNTPNIESVLDTVSSPFREIDSTKKVFFLEKDSTSYIGIKFPYDQNIILLIKTIAKENDGSCYFDKQIKTYLLEYSPMMLYSLVNEVYQSFDIEDQVMNQYDKIKNFINNKKENCPGIFDFEILNVNPDVKQQMINHYGHPCKSNLIQYFDNRNQWGLYHFDENHLQELINETSSLTQALLSRTSNKNFVNSNEFMYIDIINSLQELNRDQLVIVLPDLNKLKKTTEVSLLSSYHYALSKYYKNSEISVMCRMSNKGNGANFNQYVKDNNINKPLSKETKVVILTSTKLPKPLLKFEQFKPRTMIVSEEYKEILSSWCYSPYMSRFDMILFYDQPIELRDKIEAL